MSDKQDQGPNNLGEKPAPSPEGSPSPADNITAGPGSGEGESKTFPAGQNNPPSSENPPTGEEGESPDEPSIDPNQEVTTTHGELEELRQKAELAEEYLAALQLSKADLINYQKRVRQDLERTRTLAVKGVIENLLPIIDNFALAMKATDTATNVKDIIVGLEMMESEFEKFLSLHNVQTIKPEGKPFDPNFHEAMAQEPTDEHEPNTVVDVFQKGYAIGDVILRPAKVKVAQPLLEGQSTEQPEGEEETSS